MTDRGRIALIFTAVAAAAGAGGYYFLGVYRPKAALAAARTDVMAWDSRYATARACLLGPTPASSVTREALAVREMSPDPWDRGSCTALISRLSRDAANSGLDAVEHAWGALDAAASAAAQAFATHIASATTLTKDPLPGALDALDAARLALFGAVQLAAPATSGRPLPAAVLVPLADGNERVIELHTWAPPSAHGAVWFGKTASRIVQLTLPAGGTPVIARLGPKSRRAARGGAWGITRTSNGGVRVGTFDAEGAMSEATDLPVEAVEIIGVGGTRDRGVAAYVGRHELVILDVTASGVTPSQTLPYSIAAGGAMDVDGSLAAWWWDATTTVVHARRWHDGVAQDVPPLTTAYPAGVAACLTDDGVALGAAARDGDKLLGCTASAAVKTTSTPGQLQLTGATQRVVEMPSAAAPTSTIAIVDDKLVAYGIYSGVLGAWREDGERRFFTLPRELHLVHDELAPALAMTDGKVVDLLARDDDGFALIRVSATGP